MNGKEESTTIPYGRKVSDCSYRNVKSRIKGTAMGRPTCIRRTNSHVSAPDLDACSWTTEGQELIRNRYRRNQAYLGNWENIDSLEEDEWTCFQLDNQCRFTASSYYT